jgi:hypothetical protein
MFSLCGPGAFAGEQTTNVHGKPKAKTMYGGGGFAQPGVAMGQIAQPQMMQMQVVVPPGVAPGQAFVAALPDGQQMQVRLCMCTRVCVCVVCVRRLQCALAPSPCRPMSWCRDLPRALVALSQVMCPPGAGPGQPMTIQVPAPQVAVAQPVVMAQPQVQMAPQPQVMMAPEPLVMGFAITPEMQQQALSIGPQDQVPLLDPETRGVLAATSSFRVNQRVKFWEGITGGCIEQANTCASIAAPHVPRPHRRRLLAAGPARGSHPPRTRAPLPLLSSLPLLSYLALLAHRTRRLFRREERRAPLHRPGTLRRLHALRLLPQPLSPRRVQARQQQGPPVGFERRDRKHADSDDSRA